MSERCPICGQDTMTMKRETFHDTISGLPHVFIVNMETWRCTSCGEHSVSYPQHAQNLRMLAQEVVMKGSRLTGDEVRFLRKHVQWSGTKLAKHLGVSAETVSRWENGHEVIGPVADRLVRLVIAAEAEEEGLRYEVANLVRIAETPVPVRITLTHVPGKGWVRAELPKVTRAKAQTGRAKRTAA